MNLSNTAKKMILVMGVSSLIFIAAGTIYYRSLSVTPFALGVLLGMSLNVLKIVMLERNIDSALKMEGKNAENFIRLQYLLRFLLTGIVLVLAATTPFISLWGTAAGIFTLQIAAMASNYFPGRD